MAACPDPEWRLIIALARFAGIRTPSELVPLTWDNVLWDKGKIFIRSPKTEHHEGRAARFAPIFPELKPFLEDAFERAESGTVYLCNRYRDAGKNLRQQFERIVVRAGVTPWPKLFQNLRASRETELAATFPLHVVCSWLGNSPLIAQKHYLTVTDADFQRGATDESAEKSAAESGAVGGEALQNPVRSLPDSEGRERTQPVAPESVSPLLSIPDLSCTDVHTPRLILVANQLSLK